MLQRLQAADRVLRELRSPSNPLPEAISESNETLSRDHDFDVVVCGGTLGIFIAAALQVLGNKVVVIERGVLRGRVQEWNISRKEMQSFVKLGLLSQEELDNAIVTEYNPGRVGFYGSQDVWVRDVLNTGVDPVYLIDKLKAKFISLGGVVLENTAFEGATVYRDAVEVRTPSRSIVGRLLLDCLGNLSPIAKQARQGRKPDSICTVVGTCATGLPDSKTGDLIYSFTPIQDGTQYFWEAFPAKDGRTTYMFTYSDADPSRQSLEDMFGDYLKYLPEYQGVAVSDIQPLRALFGFFPSYRDSPLKPLWDRVQHIGDSSGNQSPLSFGGFGSMVRHLERLSTGIHEALENDQLAKSDLAILQPYQPSLSVAWLFQKTMSVGVNQQLPPEHINKVLAVVFNEMEKLGDPVLRPFLQDVIQLGALSRTMAAMSLADPPLVLRVMAQVGPAAIAEWTGHFAALAGYTIAAPVLRSLFLEGPLSPTDPRAEWRAKRLVEAIEYGSGGDYTYHPPSST